MQQEQNEQLVTDTQSTTELQAQSPGRWGSADLALLAFAILAVFAYIQI